MAAVVKDPAPRVISPILLVLAGLCFLLPFAGVSCNTAPASAELRSLSSISQALGGGALSSSDTRALTGCLNSLNSYTVATYSGLDLAAGSAPSAASGTPGGCSAFSATAGSPSPPTSAAAAQIAIGVQPLLLVALAAMLLGLLVSLFRFVLRGVVVAVAATAAIILLLVEQAQMSSQILDRITQSAFGALSLPGGSILAGPKPTPDIISNIEGVGSGFFRVSVGIGLILAVAALGVAVLYNLAAQLVPLLVRSAPAGPPDAYETDVGAPPGG
jgi:hypothetical protein